MDFIKEITKLEIQVLLDNGILHHSNKGYVNKKGTPVGFYRCTGSGKKRYIEDKYQKIASELVRQNNK